MKKGLFLLIFTVVFSACQNVEKTKKPDNLIAEDKMVEVLTEISIMTSARNFNKRKFEATGIKPEEYIYEKFEIDSLQFEQSNAFYAENYTQYENIYRQVKENLQSMKDKLDSIREVERKVNDSILAAEEGLDSLQIDSLKVKSDSLKLEQDRKLDSLINPRSIEVQ
ncbi:MAG: DUF4296 domain-containing protein [Salegentibacter sp.]|uniref:DUF4296 domain-containing protein n=1 Tax=Salegentibacter flavus TaxID=287099 RepID=A0A1I5ARE6_9FLAO|nr:MULTISPECIES: DUF4296 domain-containing protein [Salegentibacter]MDR9456665.1 DUF4296 domain-containing protein [Salegentibacter sp.]SFN64960.1 protein of unknown function [Salegentibacter flavus]